MAGSRVASTATIPLGQSGRAHDRFSRTIPRGTIEFGDLRFLTTRQKACKISHNFVCVPRNDPNLDIGRERPHIFGVISKNVNNFLIDGRFTPLS